MSDNRFTYENPQDSENYVNVYVNMVDGLCISVSDEQAMDSYNSTFTCDICLPTPEAKRLRDYLNREFPTTEAGRN